MRVRCPGRGVSMKLTKPYIQPCRGEAHRKLLDVLNYSNVSKLCSLKGIGKQVGCPLLCVCVCVCVCRDTYNDSTKL